MFTALKVLWTATRGHRLMPWRSPYLRWRLETYTGLHAEQITLGDFARFAWRERGQIGRYLRWTRQMRKLASPERKTASESQSG